MALRLTGRNPARFEFDDGVSQTTVTVQPDDTPDVVRAKLYRVLELEGSTVPRAAPAAPRGPEFTAADRAATDARLAGAQTMGWGEHGPDIETLPER